MDLFGTARGVSLLDSVLSTGGERYDGFDMKLLEDAGKCPNCSSSLDKSLRLKLVFQPSITCPYCSKDLHINERRAFFITLPAYAIIAVALSVYTDLSPGKSLIAILLIVAFSYYPSRSIEILLSRLKVVEG